MRQEDLAAAEGELTVIPRVNDNRARAKSPTPRTIPVSPEVIRLYADYLHEEYGDLDSDYVFVNLWGQPFGRPWGYPAIYDLVVRLRRVTGIDFDPHWYRHTYAIRLLRKNTPIEVVSTLLGHSSITTTLSSRSLWLARWPHCWTGRLSDGRGSSMPITPHGTARMGRSLPPLRLPVPGGLALRQRMGSRVSQGRVGASLARNRGPQAAEI